MKILHPLSNKDSRHFLSRYHILAFSIFAVALFIRLFAAFELKQFSPFFEYPVVDAMNYDRLARIFAETGEWPEKGAFYQPPLYPVFLASVYKLLGGSYFYPRLIQALLGAISCIFVYFIGKRFAGRLVGWLSGMTCAVYGPLVFFDLELLAPSLTIFCFLAGLLFLFRGLDSRKTHEFFLSGLCSGLATISWALTGLYVVATIFTLSVFLFSKQKVTKLALLAAIAGTALAVFPVTAINFSKGDPVFLSTNGGITLYAANNEDWKQTVLYRPGYNWEKMMTLPNRKTGNRNMSSAERTRFYIAESVKYATTSPIDYLQNVTSKLYYLVYGFEIMNPTDVYFLKRFSTVLNTLTFQTPLLKFPFGLLFPCAALGILLSFRINTANNIILSSYLFWGMLGFVFFLVSARFRLILIPLFAIYGAYGIKEFWKIIAAKVNGKHIIGLLILSVVSFCLANFNLFGKQRFLTDPVLQSQNYFAMGRVMIRQGNYDDALPWLEQAVEIDPDYSDAWVDLGRAKYSLNDVNGAIQAMERARIVSPDYPLPLFNLARIFDMQGRHRIALSYYENFLITADGYLEAQLRGEERINLAKRRMKEIVHVMKEKGSTSP